MNANYQGKKKIKAIMVLNLVYYQMHFYVRIFNWLLVGCSPWSLWNYTLYLKRKDGSCSISCSEQKHIAQADLNTIYSILIDTQSTMDSKKFNI